MGLSYKPLFSYFSTENNLNIKIHADDFVTTDDGTGLVHMAPAFGEDDHRVMAQAGCTEVHCQLMIMAVTLIQSKITVAYMSRMQTSALFLI